MSRLNITLRLWEPQDLPLLQRLMGDPNMTEYLGGPESPEQILSRHEKYLNLARSGNNRGFAILVGEKQTPAGWVGYWEHEEDGETVWETGWSVLPQFQGQGVATKAAAEIIVIARQVGLHRFLDAYPAVENVASNAICKKLGFLLHHTGEIEYPKGHMMLCNVWRLDLYAGSL